MWLTCSNITYSGILRSAPVLDGLAHSKRVNPEWALLGYVLTNPNYTDQVALTNLTSQFSDTVAFMNALQFDMNWYLSHLLGYQN
jgi:hypothetical protein